MRRTAAPSQGATMRALVADPSAAPALRLADVPEPKPGPGELLVPVGGAPGTPGAGATTRPPPARRLAAVPDPNPGRGELLVRMEAASVNRGEVRMAGLQPAGKVIGWDVAGRVLATGEGVHGFGEGDRVVAVRQDGGSFAEQVVVPAAWAAPLRPGLGAAPGAHLP